MLETKTYHVSFYFSVKTVMLTVRKRMQSVAPNLQTPAHRKLFELCFLQHSPISLRTTTNYVHSSFWRDSLSAIDCNFLCLWHICLLDFCNIHCIDSCHGLLDLLEMLALQVCFRASLFQTQACLSQRIFQDNPFPRLIWSLQKNSLRVKTAYP